MSKKARLFKKHFANTFKKIWVLDFLISLHLLICQRLSNESILS